MLYLDGEHFYLLSKIVNMLELYIFIYYRILLIPRKSNYINNHNWSLGKWLGVALGCGRSQVQDQAMNFVWGKKRKHIILD